MKKILLTVLLVGGTIVGAYAHGHNRHHGHGRHHPVPHPVIVSPVLPAPVVVVNQYPTVCPPVRTVVVPARPVVVKPWRFRSRCR